MEAAKRILKSCTDESVRSNDSFNSARASLELAGLLLQEGRVGESRELLGFSVTVFRSLGCRVELARALVALGVLLFRTGDLEGAKVYIAEAVDVCRKEGIEKERVEASLLLARILEREGKPGDALKVVDSEVVSYKLTRCFPYLKERLLKLRESIEKAGRIELQQPVGPNALVSTMCAAGAGLYEENHSASGDVLIEFGSPGYESGNAAEIPIFAESVPGINVSTACRERGRVNDQGRFITADRNLISTLRMMRRAASLPFPILIMGETGVGKELLGRLVHEWSGRSGRPFVVFNAAAVPGELFDSLIFGHRRGSFTGAVADQRGFVEAARDGTIFIDEVGELDLSLQAKLLRMIDLGEYIPLGETRVRRSTARIIAASNRDLRKGVDNGTFRRDLFHRLSVLSFVITPLRERANDIELIARYIIRSLSERCGMPRLDIDSAAMKILTSYDWPGNVRELQGEIVKAAVKAEGRRIKVHHLSVEVILKKARCATDAFRSGPCGEELSLEGCHESGDLKGRLEEIEAFHIIEALSREGWNVTRAARRLGLKRTTMISRMKRLGIY